MEDDYKLFEPIQPKVKSTTPMVAKLAESYYKPTPFRWRLVGDSILIVGSTITTVAGLISLSPYIIAAGAICTAIGKILTNFTSK